MTEMFDKWDELWKEDLKDGDVARRPAWLVNKDWLYEVKAEGDKFRRALVQLEIPERMEMHEQLKAVKTWLKNAKAQGRISMSDGMKLDEILEAS